MRIYLFLIPFFFSAMLGAEEPTTAPSSQPFFPTTAPSSPGLVAGKPIFLDRKLWEGRKDFSILEKSHLAPSEVFTVASEDGRHLRFYIRDFMAHAAVELYLQVFHADEKADGSVTTWEKIYYDGRMAISAGEFHDENGRSPVRDAEGRVIYETSFGIILKKEDVKPGLYLAIYSPNQGNTVFGLSFRILAR